MAPYYLLLLLVVSGSSAQNLRHYGGSVSFTPKGLDSHGSYQVDLRDRQTAVSCYQDSYTCLYGDCGSQTQSTSTLLANHSYGWDWCQYEKVTTVKLNSSLPFAVRFPTTFSSTLGRGNWAGNDSEWTMMAHVDLGTRSDTGQSNRPPTTSILPLIRIPRNCPRSFNLTVFDPDGDRVRCRVPTDSRTYECGTCGLAPGFSLDQNSCSLAYDPGSDGLYQIELVLEDFPRDPVTLSYSDGSSVSKLPSTTEEPVAPTTAVEEATSSAGNTTWWPHPVVAPLSMLPVQFSILADADVPSCLEGDYVPIFLSPTPRNGVNLPAFVNRTLKIKVRSSAKYGTINDLMVTGPAGVSKQRISPEEFLVAWTPTQDELDDHFTICFVSEAKTSVSESLLHSELRCVTVDVQHHDATVTCNETTMKVEVKKDQLIRRYENKLRLMDFTDPSCSLATSSNSTHLVSVIPLSACGTIIEEENNNIIFRNRITSADQNQTISRNNDVDVVFECVYPKRSNLTLKFTHKDPYVFTEKEFGTFTFQFEFFESQRFLRQINGSRYPVEVDVKEMMFMQIEASTSIPNVQLFVESCRATPYDNPNSRISYTIIENGCVKDDTVQIYPGSMSQFRFGMEAFEFIGAQPEVYISCLVILCDSGNPETRCSQGCLPSNSRGKRAAAAQTSRRFISQGPLHLVKASGSRAPGPMLNLGLDLVFIVGCLLVCGGVVYVSRRFRARASAVV